MEVAGEILLDKVLVPAHALAWGLLERALLVKAATNKADRTTMLVEAQARAACLAAAVVEVLGGDAESGADLDAALIELLDQDGTTPATTAVIALAITAADSRIPLAQALALSATGQITACQSLLFSVAVDLKEAAEAAMAACSGGKLRIDFSRNRLALVRTRRRRSKVAVPA